MAVGVRTAPVRLGFLELRSLGLAELETHGLGGDPAQATLETHGMGGDVTRQLRIGQS